jgi:hypothetical protein
MRLGRIPIGPEGPCLSPCIRRSDIIKSLRTLSIDGVGGTVQHKCTRRHLLGILQ